jgi:hypothetical protein
LQKNYNGGVDGIIILSTNKIEDSLCVKNNELPIEHIEITERQEGLKKNCILSFRKLLSRIK